MVDEAARSLGGIDVLVSNAGITRNLDFLDTDQKIYDQLFDLNARGCFFCAQRAVVHMLRRGEGTIVNVAYVHGRAGLPGHATYAASKGALDALTRALAIELAPHTIRINTAGPGVVEVSRYFDIPGYTTGLANSLVPAGREGRPADIAGAVSFLVSEAASFIAGQILYVDGGIAARMGLWWEHGRRR